MTPFLTLVKLLSLALVPTFGLAGFRFFVGAPFNLGTILQTWLFASGVLWVASRTRLRVLEGVLQISPNFVALLGFILGLGLVYWLSDHALAAWLLLVGIYAASLALASTIGTGLSLWQKIILEVGFFFTVGLLPPLMAQIETRFSSEEFFVALEFVGLAIFWLFLRGIQTFWIRGSAPSDFSPLGHIPRTWLISGLVLAAFLGILLSLQAYQNSFYPTTALEFPGITSETPFICGETQPSTDVYQGPFVFQQLLEQVEAHPNKSAPEYGLLALGTGEQVWALQFRETLLAEATAGNFTEPTGSIKYGQFLASLRAYFYPRVRDAFPGLFTPAEEHIIQNWFAAINQRAMTVEWVDWMYALAFRSWPQGPYENQENGAGLLALLETSNLSDPALTSQNQAYLAENPRGWLARFRVTDDAAVYQPEWIENAWFQALYTGGTDPINQSLAFEWLKILALPDGSPLHYNHIGELQYANTAYLGARLLDDENLMWLSGRAMDKLVESTTGLSGQPGTEQRLSLPGKSPTIGSCLLFGNSGLPTQIGPLAPDKVVFRSGWDPDDFYLLLNLRFSGWHRYKATNAIVQLYQNGHLVVENYAGEVASWLPAGRSLFRDKRIPRENLNGLVIGKNGLDSVISSLTGVGSLWAQDPPYYAEVMRFETTSEYDLSVTRLADWRGWQHQRTVVSYPRGIVLVFDDVQGPQKYPAALVWHLVGKTIPQGNRIPLGNGPQTGKQPEAVLIPISGDPPEIEPVTPQGDLPLLRVQYNALPNGHLQTMTLFLLKDWSGAEVNLEANLLRITQGDRQISIPLDEFNDER